MMVKKNQKKNRDSATVKNKKETFFIRKKKKSVKKPKTVQERCEDIVRIITPIIHINIIPITFSKIIMVIHFQMNSYLEEDEDFEILNKSEYSLVKSVFLKYNTIVPTSAPVERSFSFASEIDRARRALSNKNFEMLVLLKRNCDI